MTVHDLVRGRMENVNELGMVLYMNKCTELESSEEQNG